MKRNGFDRIIFALITGWVVLSFSCTEGQGGGRGEMGVSGAPSTLESRVAPPSAGAEKVASNVGAELAPEPQPPKTRPQGVQPLIIRSADLSAEVDDVSSVAAEITRIAESAGGYILSSNAYKSEGERENLILTLKVPSDRFFEALDRIRKAIGAVESETISGEDFTEEYVDLESRLKSLEATYNRLLDMLRIAKNAKEALEVNRALDEVTQQLEQVKGRMRYLRESAAMSTIIVRLRSTAKVLPQVKTEKWSPAHTLKTAFAFSLDSLKALSTLVIWVVAGFWYLIVAAIAVVAFRYFRTRPSRVKA